MADSAAPLVDEILPHQPMRQWVLSVPFPLRFLFASNPKAMTGAQGCAGTAISRLVALVPRPRVNLTRFHGVFAPNSKYRVQITPAKRGKVNKPGTPEDDRTPAEHRAAMTWAQRLKRVFNIDVA